MCKAMWKVTQIPAKKKSKWGLCKNERRVKRFTSFSQVGHAQLLHNDKATICNSWHFGLDVLCDNNINAMIVNTKRVVKCWKVSLLGLNLMLRQY
jgi:hypothetical protein